ncbi:hypothetical protein HDU97_003886 [Phlyctochytrium planicorne]|nr:hypothetical protein HDU97_003886 [Phlyctochytrium planicorne]
MSYLNLGEDYNSEEDEDWQPGSEDEEDDEDVDEEAEDEDGNANDKDNGDSMDKDNEVKMEPEELANPPKRKRGRPKKGEVVIPKAKKEKKTPAKQKVPAKKKGKKETKKPMVEEEEEDDCEDDEAEEKSHKDINNHVKIPRIEDLLESMQTRKPRSVLFDKKIFTDEFEDFLERRTKLMIQAEKELQDSIPPLKLLKEETEKTKAEVAAKKKILQQRIDELEAKRAEEIAFYGTISNFFLEVFAQKSKRGKYKSSFLCQLTNK